MYTLTASNSRTKVLLAKILTISSYAVVFALLVGIISPIASYLGVHAHGHTLVPQTLHYGELVWRSLFYGWGFAMAGLLFATLIRSQIGSIAALFVVPGLVEQLLTLLLKEKAVYLPFTAIDAVLNANPKLSFAHAALVFAGYLAVGWIAAWVLFVKRDAN
jgi:ABC-type transport system involved in multi-copper enzyme maturation permease subunit